MHPFNPFQSLSFIYPLIFHSLLQHFCIPKTFSFTSKIRFAIFALGSGSGQALKKTGQRPFSSRWDAFFKPLSVTWSSENVASGDVASDIRVQESQADLQLVQQLSTGRQGFPGHQFLRLANAQSSNLAIQNSTQF